MKRFLLLLVMFPGLSFADKSLDKDATWDCSKDANVKIGNGKGTYTFTGACKVIDVGGGENKLTIESVETLKVGGGKNTISVGTVGTVDVGGEGNTITWKKAAAGDKPTLKGQPDKNKISQTK